MRVKVTAKVKAVTPNLSHHTKLLQFLRAYRNWTQYIVDQVWELDHVPSIRELHQRFYRMLRNRGFRAHHCHKIERRAREIVKAMRMKMKNGEKVSKPILRKLTARLDYQDYKLNLENKTLSVAVLNGEWVELKLIWYRRLDSYFNGEWKLKEILVSYRDNTIWVYLTFEREVIVKPPRAIMGVDINFNNITYTIVDLRGKLVSVGVIPFTGLARALTHRKMAEKLQRKYPKSWRFNRKVLEVIRKHHRRARNILFDSSHYVSRRIVEVAREYNAIIVLEDLNKLRAGVNGGKRFNWKLSLWVYRRIQAYIHYKATLEGLMVTYVNPKGTSRTSPLGGKLEFINYRWVKLPSGIITTRDVIAAWNLALRGCIPHVVGGGMKASEGDEAPNPMKGKPVQVSNTLKIT